MRKKIHVVINKSSGTVLRLGEDTVAAMLTDRFGDVLQSIHMVETQEICKVIDTLGHDPAHHDLIIGGGDGTAVCAAEHLADRNVHFGMLPLGTMNLLAQDLGAAPTFEETMERLSAFYEDTIDLGMVNGRFFLCSAVIGLVPESAQAREELREGIAIDALSRFIGAITRGMSGQDKCRLKLRLGRDEAPIEHETTSLIISNNRFVPNPDMPSARFLRESLKDGKLAVYSAAPSDMIDGVRLLVRMMQGAWQKDDAVLSFETPSLMVDTSDHQILISLDGEPMEMTTPLEFSIRPQSLPVLRMELAA